MGIPLLALSALLLALPLQAQDDVVFRSSVSLVRVDAEVVDAAGAVVEGLTAKDFRILDDGQPRNIANFSFAEEPLDLILLFDTAGSMHAKLLEIMRATQLGFNELRKGDRVCVRVFSNTSSEMLPFSGNLEQVNQAIVLRALSLRANGSSKLEAAANEAALRFNAEPKTRRKRGILIITDKPGAKGPDQMPIVRDLWNADAVLSELILDRPGPEPRMIDRGTDELVGKTGGAAIIAGNPGEAFRESVHYLRSGYAIYYELPNGAGTSPHSLQVELTPEAAARFPNARIRARSGYLTGRQLPSVPPAAN